LDGKQRKRKGIDGRGLEEEKGMKSWNWIREGMGLKWRAIVKHGRLPVRI
jgi:hypothetical protein